MLNDEEKLRKGELVVQMANLKPNKQRRYHVIVGTCPRDEIIAFDDDIRSMQRALLERLFFIEEGGEFKRPVRPQKGVFESTSSNFCEDIKRFLPKLIPISDQDFVDHYSGKKRIMYQKAADELKLRRINRADSHIKGFQKWQKENKTMKPDAPPRWISPRSYEYIVRLGTYIKPLEKRIYAAINDLFDCTAVAKGLNATDRAAAIVNSWGEFNIPIAIPMDTSRFEQCVSMEALQFEHKIYKMCFPKDKEFARLLEWQIYNIGKARSWNGTLKFRCIGNRMSGDDNTALGNTLITLMLLYCWSKRTGVKIKPIADGDDSVAIMEQSDRERFMDGCKSWYRKLGFRMKIEKAVDVLEHIDFCQSRPVWTPQGYLMVREVNVGIAKDSVCLTRLHNEKMMRSWLKAVGDGGISLTGGIPVYQNFYQMYRRESRGQAPIKWAVEFEAYKYYKYLGMDRKATDIHERTRYSFWLAFGLTPSDQESIEQYYDSMVIEEFNGELNEAIPSGHLPWAW